MARKATAAVIVPTPAPKAAPMHGPREENPRRRRRGRKGRRRNPGTKGKKKNPKKNLGYGAKVGIAIASIVVVGGGGYLAYRHFKKAPTTTVDPSLIASGTVQAFSPY